MGTLVLTNEGTYDTIVNGSSTNGQTYIVPGSPETSYLYSRVMGLGGEARMPFNEDPLSDEALATIEAWILDGAER